MNANDEKRFLSIKEYCSTLKRDYPALSDYQLLKLAIQMQRNDILKAGLNVRENKDDLTALEAIDVQLGIYPDGREADDGPTVLSEIQRIADCLENK
ncbi:MAG: hypothetical protein LBG19_02270 [Prevotellaceae bacterium]|nr:hypothetical protein [Prevotellaceae bacterium]